MAVEFDTLGAGNRVTSTSTISWSHTRSTPGGNHCVWVVVAVSGATTVGFDDASITKTATYGDVSMAYVGGVNVNNATSNAGWLYFFVVGDPPKGTSTITVSITKAGFTPAQITGNSVGFYNVLSRGPFLYGAGASFGSITLTAEQAPIGIRQIIGLTSSTSAILPTGPTGIRNLYNNGAAATGLADFLSLAEVISPSAGYTMPGNNGGNWAAGVVSMNEAPPLVYGQEQLTSYTSAGGYAYDIPPWASHIDIVLCGGGGGGEGSVSNLFTGSNGSGGDPGEWKTVTVQRGVDIPWTTTTITGTVGAGGAGGPVNTIGQPGESTTASATGMTTITATGGIARSSGSETGFGPGNRSYNSQQYIGGADQPPWGGGHSGVTGFPPGGGGSGSTWGTSFQGPGGAGAQGAAYFYAYNTGSSLFFKMF